MCVCVIHTKCVTFHNLKLNDQLETIERTNYTSKVIKGKLFNEAKKSF